MQSFVSRGGSSPNSCWFDRLEIVTDSILLSLESLYSGKARHYFLRNSPSQTWAQLILTVLCGRIVRPSSRDGRRGSVVFIRGGTDYLKTHTRSSRPELGLGANSLPIRPSGTKLRLLGTPALLVDQSLLQMPPNSWIQVPSR